MRTSVIAIVIALAGVAHADRWQAGAGIEASVIGESFGVRGEGLWRIAGASHARVALGVLPGPEFTFVPVSVGYRAIWRQAHTVQPFAGAGWENQHFVIADAPTVHRWWVAYVEGGCGFAVHDRLAVGLATSLDVAFVRDVGAGLQLRAFGSWRF